MMAPYSTGRPSHCGRFDSAEASITSGRAGRARRGPAPHVELLAHAQVAGAHDQRELVGRARGARSGWLDAVLAQHAFVVLVFYRGFW